MLGVHADGVVTIFETEVVCFAIHLLMHLIRTTTFQIFPTTHLSPIHSIYKFAMDVDLLMIFVCAMLQKHSLVLIVGIHPTKDYRVGNVFVTNVDTSIVYVTPRVLKRLTLMIRVLIIILRTISIFLFKTFMSKYQITMIIRFKIRQILKIVGIV